MNSPFDWPQLKFWDSGEWQKLQERMYDLEDANHSYHPVRENMFAPFDYVPFSKVKVVIIGQDPYPNPKHATGMAFSVPEGVEVYPPTLKNIFDEYVRDLGYKFPKTGNLNSWAAQGVLMFNVIPMYWLHNRKNQCVSWPEWEEFNKEVLTELSNRHDGIVFVAWGAEARRRLAYVDRDKHKVIEASHPSPLGYNYSFKNSRPFSTINIYLSHLGHDPIDWRLDDVRDKHTQKSLTPLFEEVFNEDFWDVQS